MFDAIYPAVRNDSFFPELSKRGLRPHQIEELWFWAPLRANRNVDILRTLEQKIQALRCHKSQIADMKEIAKRIRKFAQQGKKRRYVETFWILKLV